MRIIIFEMIKVRSGYFPLLFVRADLAHNLTNKEVHLTQPLSSKWIFEFLQNNTKEFLEAMYTTVALISVEMAAIDESSSCLIDFIESIQSIAVQETGCSKLLSLVNELSWATKQSYPSLPIPGRAILAAYKKILLSTSTDENEHKHG